MGDTAAQILATAKDLIARQGVDALRLATIGSRLGISTPAIYAHFPGGRSALIDRVAHDGVQAMMGFFPLAAGSARDNLFCGIADLVRFYAENPAFLRIMLLDFSLPEGHPSLAQEIGRPGPFATGAFREMYARLEHILKALTVESGARQVAADVLLNVVLGATALNLIYPPAATIGNDRVAGVQIIVADLVGSYLSISVPFHS